MTSINGLRKLAAFSAAICCGLATLPTHAQPSAVDHEVKQLSGHWRVVEMVEDGRAIPEEQMRQLLPGGGILEVVDYTILFRSPIDGAKSTKTYRVEPTAYPKRIAIMDRDQITGTGIYKFDQGRLVLCITNQASQIPTQFNAPTGSGHSLIIMERFDPGDSTIPGLNAPVPQSRPVQMAAAERTSYDSGVPALPASSRLPAAQPTPQPQPQPTPQPVVGDRVASQILTDEQVKNMAVGTWRINDSEGSVDIVFDANGIFRTYRYARTVSNFHVIFVPTPISAGNWSVTNGRLIANVTSSTRLDKVNQTFIPAVRSISATDMILVDHLGRVERAVKLR